MAMTPNSGIAKVEEVKVPEDCGFVVRADCEFMVYQVLEGRRFPVGPDRVTDRVFRCSVSRQKRLFEVMSPELGMVAWELTPGCARQEYPDPTPVEVGGLDRPPTLQEEIRRFVREELSKHAEEQGFGTFEEEDDFDDDDDDELRQSQYEEMAEETPRSEFSKLGKSPGPQKPSDLPSPPTDKPKEDAAPKAS